VAQRLPGAEADADALADALINLTEPDALTGLFPEDYEGLLNYNAPGTPIEIPDEWWPALDGAIWWFEETSYALSAGERLAWTRMT